VDWQVDWQVDNGREQGVGAGLKWPTVRA
jgi:hypothetical protein